MYESSVSQDSSFAYLGVDGSPDSPLVQMLMAPAIVPGTGPSYELAKTIFSYHPLGGLLAAGPITLAQSQPREINVGALGAERIVEQFENTAKGIGVLGETVLIHNLMTLSRVYGIASLGIGEQGVDPEKPLDVSKLADADLFFNTLDPLNTAGSLVLNQDPNSPMYLKPSGFLHVSGKKWHPSRVFVKMNEQPLYIEWSSSAFGFVGRSIYQRPLFPLKTFLQTMITDQMVTQKAGLLVAKMEQPGSIIDNVMQAMFGWKRGKLRDGVTGQVLAIGVSEEIETLNMQNVDKAMTTPRTNVLKNIASAAGMPATLIAQETMSAEFHEGSEDAKKEAAYLTYIRADMQGAYDFMDRIVMRQAWTPEFYETLFVDFPEYKKIPFETAFHNWVRSFKATWPNLLTEPDSEKSKTADVKLKALVALAETMVPDMDPENKANFFDFLAANVNELEDLFVGRLDIDSEKLKTYLEENRAEASEALKLQGKQAEEPPGKVRPFSAAS